MVGPASTNASCYIRLYAAKAARSSLHAICRRAKTKAHINIFLGRGVDDKRPVTERPPTPVVPTEL